MHQSPKRNILALDLQAICSDRVLGALDLVFVNKARYSVTRLWHLVHCLPRPTVAFARKSIIHFGHFTKEEDTGSVSLLNVG